MTQTEKLEKINKATNQSLTMKYIEKGAREYGITVDEMLDLMIESIEENI